MFSRLLNNWPYKLFSLLIAVGIVWYVTETNHPHGDKRIVVPLALNDLPPGLVETSATPDVTLLVSGPGSDLENITSSSFRATVNLAGFHAGNNLTQKIDVEPLPGIPEDISIDGITPQFASLTLENTLKTKFHISVNFDNIAPNGLSYGTPTVVPPVGSVQGPESLVSKISKLEVDGREAISGETIAPGMLDGFAPIIAKDAQQNPIMGVTILPSQADVKVPVNRQVGIKQVLVNAVFTGRPSFPYVVNDVEVIPNAVTIQGSPDQLGSYSVIKTNPIDLSGATGDLTKTVAIYTPPGISSSSPTTVTVKVNISRSSQFDNNMQGNGSTNSKTNR